jgi:hypothetical protein
MRIGGVMATAYRIYQNDFSGGPIDYATVVDDTASLTYAAAPIPVNSDVSFAVRAYDTVSGLEERNTDAVVRIVTDAAGINRANTPASPTGLTVTATAGGTAKVEWSYPPGVPSKRPSGFRVWFVASPGPINYAATPDAVADFMGPGAHRATLSGLTDGVDYLVGVRAYNSDGDDGNSSSVVVTGSTIGPDAVEGLTGSLL